MKGRDGMISYSKPPVPSVILCIYYVRDVRVPDDGPTRDGMYRPEKDKNHISRTESVFILSSTSHVDWTTQLRT